MLSRLFALSVVLHGLFFVAVMYVPQARSLALVAGQLSGIEFVSEDYDRSLVGQRATIVNISQGPPEKLFYPADYFGPVADPAMMMSPDDPLLVQQAAPPPPPVVISRPRRSRQPRVVSTAEPEASPSPETAEATPTPGPDAAAADPARQQAEAEMDAVARSNNIERPPRINTKPFEDIANKGKQLYDAGKLNLNASVGVTVTADRNSDGTLNRETVKFEWEQAADETMNALAQEFVTAISESRVLSILKDAKQVRMALKLDQQTVSVRVATSVESGSRAEQMATGYGLLLLTARKAKQGTEEGELYNRLKVNSEGQNFVMSFEMPRDAAGKMISEMLAKKAAAAAAAPGRS
ncbi:MAG TPA: hypothetical protein VEY09_13710 [Pyrinomonadaceae bacterium]|nr:hypothetical protein [Pyrinomonadaceae bacterium]